MHLFTMRVTASGMQRVDVLRTLRSFAGATSTRRGCLTVHLVQDVDNRNGITWIEEWETEEDLCRHVRSDDFRTLLAVMDMSTSTPDVHFHAVSESWGIERIAAMRSPSAP